MTQSKREEIEKIVALYVSEKAVYPHEQFADRILVERIFALIERRDGETLEALKLWRPYFYRDTITDVDIEELPHILF